MALPLASWWGQAEGLEIGQKRRVEHACGPGSSMLLSRDMQGYRAWCFRCSDGGKAKPPQESATELAGRLAKAAEAVASFVPGAMPAPEVFDLDRWPAEARLWLYKAGLSRADIGRLGIYWHEASDRVVIPAGQPELAFYQARAYQPGIMPKYIGPSPRHPGLLVRFGNPELTPTLTEDILSAIKVGFVGYGIALLGTALQPSVLLELFSKGRCNVWLDPDAAGRRGAAKVVKQLTRYGIAARNVVSDKDPKLHTREQIKEILHES